MEMIGGAGGGGRRVQSLRRRRPRGQYCTVFVTGDGEEGEGQNREMAVKEGKREREIMRE